MIEVLRSVPAEHAYVRASESLLAAAASELVVVLHDGGLVAAAGARVSAELARRLLEAAEQRTVRVSLPGASGPSHVAAASLSAPGSWIIASRSDRPYGRPELDLLEGAAGILQLHLQIAERAATEAELRRQAEHETQERKRAERDLAYQSLHDALTGLPNRNLLRERAERSLAQARPGRPGFISMMFVDIDNFKHVNDSVDHQRGDRLLVVLAQRLNSVLTLQPDAGRAFTLARPGGDEFIVFAESMSSERDAVTVAEQIQDAVRAPVFVDGEPIRLTASVGIAIAEAAPGLDADQLLRDADVALSRAKERGRDRYEIFDAPMRARLLDRVALEKDLRAGIETGQLRLHYQPVVTVVEGTLVAVEALVRWQHPTRGLLGPGEFIPVAEESELIVSLGTWVIEEACAQIRRWRDAHPAQLGVRVSVNVSARQLSPQLIDIVAAALEENGIEASSLALEITESLLIEHEDVARSVMAGLEQLGVAIVLDDFGTGYSSLRYLSSFHVSQLKLDRSFTTDLAREARPAKIIAATIDMARALGMTIVAEGVESAEQIEVLRRLGCDYAQGFHFARPEPPAATLQRLRDSYERDQAITITPRRAAAPPGHDSDAAQRRHHVAMGRLGGWLILAGTAIMPVGELLLHTPKLPLALTLVVLGLISGLICLRLPWARLSERWISAVAVLATIEITVAVVLVGRHGTVLLPFYLLTGTATGYAFRDQRVIAAHVGLILLAMTLSFLLREQVAVGALSLTVITGLVLIVSTAAIAYMRALLEGSAAELRELAASDPLTGVGNYRCLHQRLAQEISRHEREHASFALLTIDLDHFKHINERRGHAAGDDILRRVAATLGEAVRGQDTVARQGGDEFAVLAPRTDSDGAAMLAARIRDRLSRVQFAGDSVGATVGWAVFPADGDTAAALLARADEQLMTRKLAPTPTPTAMPSA
ncbi:MAG TPA: EAL domain-containing protein [Solirubrobacteraceae bacterium]|nr:EAL domain-containing protein [Solirubrobacteraceae bacterium]